MSEFDLSSSSSATPKARILLAAVIAVALLFGWVAVRRQLGGMIAEMTPSNDPNAPAAAELARSMAPSDPITLWFKANLERNIFSPERTNAAIKLYEDTVRLSPSDFRWWIELGRAYEQAEMNDRAEASLRQAIALAPTYTFPRWQFGNFLLRQGRTDEAFAEFKSATENNQTYREQVFSLAWEYFGKDPAKLEQVIADKPDVYASLALFYGARGQAADSLRIWNKLDDAAKAAHPQFVSVIAQGLYEKRHFPEALEFAKQIGMDADAEPNTVTNGGFERGVGDEKETRFGWKIFRTDPKFDASGDTAVKHSGSRSLKVSFRTYKKAELYNIWQTVVVDPGASYKLSFWVRTENLKSGGGPQLQVINANDDKIITNSAVFAAGTNDWQQITLDVAVPANCNGITIRTVRAYCGDDCPITGTVWYDDFELKKIN